ncbi:MAG: hypothetical protein LR001_09465 [Clostridiales bacterium]|nr:hypothetical protein [Clostridiales bacterium]
MRKLRKEGKEVYVITIFTGLQNSMLLSDRARKLHSICGLGDDAMIVRKQEDLKAMKVLGVESMHLNEWEALYRINADGLHRYGGDNSFLTDNLTSEKDIMNCVENKLRILATTIKFDSVFIPLGLG